MPATVLRLLVVLLLGLGASLAAVSPAHAAEVRIIQITAADGVQPKVLTIELGDKVRFVNDDSTFLYRAEDTSENWEIDSRASLTPNGTYDVPEEELAESGTYTYEVAQDAPFAGTIKVVKPGQPATTPAKPASPKASPQAPPKAGASAAPAPAGSPAASGSPSPGAGGGTGTAVPPGFSGLGGAPGAPAPEGFAPAPSIADLPAIEGEVAPPPITAGSPVPEPSGSAAVAIAEALGGPPAVKGAVPGQGGNGLGLAALLAVVLVVGIVSLLVRLLLAEPAGRRPTLVRPIVTTRGA